MVDMTRVILVLVLVLLHGLDKIMARVVITTMVAKVVTMLLPAALHLLGLLQQVLQLKTTDMECILRLGMVDMVVKTWVLLLDLAVLLVHLLEPHQD